MEIILAVSVVLLVVYVGRRRYVLKRKEQFKNLAKSEYLNRAKVKRFISQNVHTGLFASLFNEYQLVDKINREFVEKRLAEAKPFFDKLQLTESHYLHLTESQRLAVVRDEDANLINASAGSGKTGTILAKVSYLLKYRLAKPQEILVVAYNKDVRKEIQKKVKNINPDVSVSTLHALGLKIMKDVRGKQPNVSDIADDRRKKRSPFLKEMMKEILEDDSKLNLVSRYFSTYLVEGNPEEGVQSNVEYREKVAYAGLKGLDGQTLRSHQEVQIANWLILNGIKWEYEKDYPHESGYNPDFYLTDYDLWIEHFGIDENGNTAPWIDSKKYNKDIEWKRETHRKHNTGLVETYSYEARQEGGIPSALETKLDQHGVEKRPISQKEVEGIIEKGHGPVSNFVKLIDQFLTLCRENGISNYELQSLTHSSRDRAFLELFFLFRESYEKELGDSIDYTDMIVRGTQYVKEGKWLVPYKYILVDEYQDISYPRLQFLLEIRKQVEDARLFCVGDDWQSIYSFQGANVNLITSFDRYVGVMQRTDLGETFRFSQQISDFGRIFITKNPAQLNKEVASKRDFNEQARPIRIVPHGRSDMDRRKALESIIDTISKQNENDKECFVLGRYNSSKPDYWDGLKREAELRGVFIEFGTIHNSKGREKDWVIVLDNEFDVDGYGFPSGIQNDPVLNMILETDTKFPNAEERRLFYVANTRARKEVFLLTLSEDHLSSKRILLRGKSVFLKEILQSKIRRNGKEELEYEPYVRVQRPKSP